MRIIYGLTGLILSSIVANSAIASCGSNALGTSRVLEVETSKYREIQGNEKRFGLRHKEVILTFDDGPIAGRTSRILKTLKKECVKATFFYVGKMAQAYPRLVRKVVADGHTLAHHTHNHNRLPKYSQKSASRHIDKGVAALQKIAYGTSDSTPRTPFFRYPYLARTKRTDRLLAKKGLVAFGANIDSLDWKKVSANKVHDRIMRRLRQEGKGIILMHDIQFRTAKMLPRLLRSLKDEGYKVVHMVAKGGRTPKSKDLVVARAEKPTIAADKRTNGKKAKKSTQVAMLSKSAKEKRVSLFASDADAPASKRAKKQKTSRTGVKVNSLSVASIASQKPAKLKNLKRVSKKKSSRSSRKKRKLIVLAGGKRRKKANVVGGGWKLRSSQWIIN